MSHLPAYKRNHVNVIGNDNAVETLLFIHGFGTDQSAWDAILPHFLNDYRIVLLDNMGAGLFDMSAYKKNKARYATLHGYARDVVDIINALKLEQVTIVGHSVGGMIGVRVCQECPDACSRLILIGASPRYLDDDGYHGGLTEKSLGEIHLAMQENYLSWTQNFAPIAMSNPDRPNLAHYFAETLRTIPQELALKSLMTILISDHRLELARVHTPTLILQSREDPIVPIEVAEFMHRNIANSRLKLIDATGHFPHLSAPEEIVTALRDFGLR